MLLDYPVHDGLRAYCRELNKLYQKTPALYMNDRGWDGFQWLNVNDADRSSIAFLRKDPADDSYLVCVCNFTPVQYDNFVIGLPAPGTLKEILSSDEERFGGKGVCNRAAIRSSKEGFWELPCSAKLTLPAMSTVYFRYHITKQRSKKADI